MIKYPKSRVEIYQRSCGDNLIVSSYHKEEHSTGIVRQSSYNTCIHLHTCYHLHTSHRLPPPTFYQLDYRQLIDDHILPHCCASCGLCRGGNVTKLTERLRREGMRLVRKYYGTRVEPKKHFRKRVFSFLWKDSRFNFYRLWFTCVSIPTPSVSPFTFKVNTLDPGVKTFLGKHDMYQYKVLVDIMVWTNWNLSFREDSRLISNVATHVLINVKHFHENCRRMDV